MEFVATCPKGFERILAEELAGLRIPQVRPLRGQVSFGGELADAYRACLWSRLASRVLLVLARVDAQDADALYEGLRSVDWIEHLEPGATFAVDAHGTNAQLRNTQFVALRSKDAIVDGLVSARGARPVVDVARPDVRVGVRLSGERATVSIDLTGEPLFHRGYDSRAAERVAPLRPDYAAALLAAGGWFRDVRHQDPTLVALWAGQGSVLVEAATAALDCAPGLLRPHWGFEGWAGHYQAAWEHLLADAQARAEAGSDRPLTLIAADGRRGAEAACRRALRAAGLALEPEFLPAADALDAARAAGADPLVTCDLSWMDEDSLSLEATALSSASAAAGLRMCALVRGTSLDAALRAEPASTIDVIVGRDPATLRTYAASVDVEPPATVRVADTRVPVLVAATDQFSARLAKVARLRAKWARREDVSCYRVYDADLPDYAVSIELYEGSETPGRWLQIFEYAPPRGVDLELAHRRLLDVLVVAPQVLRVAPENVYLRVRTHARGGSQYADELRADSEARGQRGLRRARPGAVELPLGARLVDEGGLTFEVNFSSRLDCGIFLDHRDTRALLREMMKETRGSKRFLNLFAYTGTATCYAADGGAKHTTTVDLSRPSLDWARRNMDRNGFTAREHEFVQADVLAWVTEQRHTTNRWDLVFCDVPTFSNSSRMRRASFDVQRDHAELIIGVSRLLTREGSALFSCNLRSFEPDVDKLRRAGVVLTDLTAQTIPEDFSRSPKIHHCYLVRRG
ncbi:bifunctional 23S rRNA (guanine(2069)-N(7))-methyltransferase RlmK/23S rRNA (guanine(2445)-N(2))-methyltransferase RlmL [Thermophilibacter immobilis]|jgi:23S rRNA (guanine2445-N2)-methyltransferase / 23S rRNA (guanine2069-N7)-methyltransferase|uniref:Ribosomal RNA large subunit methyltransferase K/L n=1 Tax=Thermophilibacter immobilis TaxID=2779519 RepID=A0A7S7M965_9ACTN|nr:bifunctional 23S rRNA (guanine(2069)-N(7))-methyltransferase RlmK/23S rRNA (guanine(2445)-N(2))-methyltransferase RlmL [Thermophilibacter immobilis]QOY61030.1 bifunctional 23S rRNA (guanine(2069)-N(7))-methyltransferase RlmK/23S rRNA (guanine(2445)-N(2))-methyltransferase RlmL [Thermophilibacter immobilis]